MTLWVPSSRDIDGPPVDWAGAALIGAAVALFVFGVIEAPTQGWSNPLVYGTLAAGLALAAAFGYVETRRRQPLLDVRLFRDPDFAVGSATITVFFAANLGFLYLIMQYFQLIMGYSAIGTAVAIAPLMVGVISMSLLSFWYVPRVGLRLVTFAGLAILSGGLFYMRTIDVDTSYLHVMWPLIVMSFGIGMVTAPASSAIMTAAPDNKQGVASAVNDAAREIGAAVGIAIAGSILAARYTDRLVGELSAFPAAVREPAADSLAQALNVSTMMGPQGGQLAELSKDAFVHAMQSSLSVMAVIIGVAAVVISVWARGRDGQQLRIVRRITSRRSPRPGARSSLSSRGAHGG
jgi:hypothetical protein